MRLLTLVLSCLFLPSWSWEGSKLWRGLECPPLRVGAEGRWNEGRGGPLVVAGIFWVSTPAGCIRNPVPGFGSPHFFCMLIHKGFLFFLLHFSFWIDISRACLLHPIFSTFILTHKPIHMLSNGRGQWSLRSWTPHSFAIGTEWTVGKLLSPPWASISSWKDGSFPKSLSYRHTVLFYLYYRPPIKTLPLLY